MVAMVNPIVRSKISYKKAKKTKKKRKPKPY